MEPDTTTPRLANLSATGSGVRQVARVGAATVVGVEAIPVLVEAVMHGDGHTVRLLGSVDRVMREAFHRVLNAFAASGLPSPRGMPTVNFCPAGLPKSGTGFDLPLALALAAAGGQLDASMLTDLAAIGEVGLDGRVHPVRGVVPVALAVRSHDTWRRLLVSIEDAPRATAVPGVEVLPVTNLTEALAVAAGASPTTHTPTTRTRSVARDRIRPAAPDMAEIHGHESAKRALCVAAAGRHNVLLIGPPGSGKSALVRRLPGLLPPPTGAEALEVLRIRSACGTHDMHDPENGAVRPFRAPHHSSSTASLLGGGPEPRPGEVTLANLGVLFLDELPEFRREALEGMRQPIEEHRITIGRAARTVTMPADFVLVAAMNPCPCGHAGDPRLPCRCSSRERRSYRARISGPLLDRFDITVWVPPLPADAYDAPSDSAWSTAGMRDRVTRAVVLADARQLGPNGRLDGKDVESIGATEPDTRDTLKRLVERMHLSGRGRIRVLRLARTVADLRGSADVAPEDLLEAGRLRAPWRDR